MTFKDKKLVYYGPHPCQECDKTGKKGTMIVRAQHGKKVFAMKYTHNAQYPNHAWEKHVCLA